MSLTPDEDARRCRTGVIHGVDSDGQVLTQVGTWGAHRRGARREGQGLYSQPREEGPAHTRRNARARAERIFRSTPSVVLFHLSRRL